MKHLKLGVFSLLAVASAADGASLADLRAQDERLLRIAEPIVAGNVQLCDRTMPDLGVSLQSTDQYPADGQPPFAAPVAFAAVLPASAAAQVGIQRDDGLVSVDGKPVAKRPDLASGPLRDSAFAAIAEHDPAQPLALGIVHAGARREISVPVKPECRIQFEILGKGDDAQSDGHTIQIGYDLAARSSDDQVAVIFAHEFAHAILHHRERQSAAGVNQGLLGEFGRNRRLNLRVEEEADRLSVYLLANANLDPHIAPALWGSAYGRKLNGWFLHSRIYPSAKERARLLEAEIAAHNVRAGVPAYPEALLATRDEPLK
jgi:hypothetical protein